MLFTPHPHLRLGLAAGAVVYNSIAMAENVIGVEQQTRRGQDVSPLNFEDMYEVIEDLLQLHHEEVDKLQMQGPDPKRVDIVTISESVWNNKDLYQHLEKKYQLQSGKIVRIVRPIEKIAEIRVKRVPSWWNEDHLKRIFGFYGSIREIFQETFSSNIDPHNYQSRNIKEIYRNLKNGNWKVKIIVRTAITSTLVVSNFKLEIFYRGQEQTCWRCGQAH